MKKENEYIIVNNAVSILAVMCAGNTDKIIDLLTGYLWDEQEAGELIASQPAVTPDKAISCDCAERCKFYSGDGCDTDCDEYIPPRR